MLTCTLDAAEFIGEEFGSEVRSYSPIRVCKHARFDLLEPNRFTIELPFWIDSHT